MLCVFCSTIQQSNLNINQIEMHEWYKKHRTQSFFNIVKLLKTNVVNYNNIYLTSNLDYIKSEKNKKSDVLDKFLNNNTLDNCLFCCDFKKQFYIKIYWKENKYNLGFCLLHKTYWLIDEQCSNISMKSLYNILKIMCIVSNIEIDDTDILCWIKMSQTFNIELCDFIDERQHNFFSYMKFVIVLLCIMLIILIYNYKN